jgi:hypothetical protein
MLTIDDRHFAEVTGILPKGDWPGLWLTCREHEKGQKDKWEGFHWI